MMAEEALQNWHWVLDNMLGQVRSALMKDHTFSDNAFDSSEITQRAITPENMLDLLISESTKSIRMIEHFLRPGIRVLEIGGGVGLTYAMLRAFGIEAVSLEPGRDGFGNRHRAGLCLLERLEIDSSGWVRSGIEEYETDQRFDLIFSHYVLEHVSNLDQAFQSMSRLLKTDGRMIHRCPNYTIPFEPHFNIPILPFRPEWTSYIFPYLKHDALWKGLQFITVGKILKLCSLNGLNTNFRRGMTAWAFDQLNVDKAFADRKKGLISTARLLRITGMLDLIRHLPPRLETPIEFVASKVYKNCSEKEA